MISFIIPTYNSYLTLPLCLKSLLDQTVKDFEIIVVDSSDDAMAKKYLADLPAGQIKKISLEKKTIPSIARNIGAKAAAGDLLCFIDSDIVLAPDWLANVLAVYEKGCLAGGGSVDIHQSQIGNDLAWAQLFLQFNEYLPTGERRKITLLPACNMFCSRNIFNEVGGFPDMRASEDVIFCLNVAKKQAMWFVPEAKAYHIFRESKTSYRDNQIMLGKYILLYRRGYLKNWYYAGLWPLALLPVIVVIKFKRMFSRIQNNSREYQKRFFHVLPLFLYGLFFWTKGFVQGIFQKEEVL